MRKRPEEILSSKITEVMVPLTWRDKKLICLCYTENNLPDSVLTGNTDVFYSDVLENFVHLDPKKTHCRVWDGREKRYLLITEPLELMKNDNLPSIVSKCPNSLLRRYTGRFPEKTDRITVEEACKIVNSAEEEDDKTVEALAEYKAQLELGYLGRFVKWLKRGNE